MLLKRIGLILLAVITLSFLFYSCTETTSTTDGPYIESIDKTSGVPGDTVKITGSGFGEYDQSKSFVYFGDKNATILVTSGSVDWYEDEIKVLVPANVSSGNITVEADGKTSNGVMFTVPSAQPPVTLQATSKDDKSVILQWSLSADETNALFTGYRIYATAQGSQDGNPVTTVLKGVNTYTVTGLTAGTIYTFKVHSILTIAGTEIAGQAKTVNWSPAFRFVENINGFPIRLYESKSKLGSGLQLFNETGSGPKTLTIETGDFWDLGLYTSDATITFGSAKNILAKYSSFKGTAKNCEMGSQKFYFNSLDELFGSVALDQAMTYSETSFDLSTDNATTNIIFIVRTNKPSWNYAKVMVLNKGGFLQTEGTEKFIEVIVSYQRTPGIPYAF